ncbi:MAG: Phage integrase family, partial [Myxococcaceae bacterium]|nr:Phage integrase family [Myxococcaceae bacterium]
ACISGSKGGSMATKKKKPRGLAHPGVVLVKPTGGRRARWQGRYKDPDSDALKWEALPEQVTTAEAREQWAKRKSHGLLKRKAELEAGAARETGTSLKDAADRYFTAHPQLRERTVEGYRASANKLVAWGEVAGVESADDLNRAKLMAFRETLILEPKRKPATGKKRGKREATEERRSPERINSELRKVGTVLGYLIDADLFPRLTRDDLRRALKRLAVTTERRDYLKPVQLQALMAACLAHDAETFAETRDEHAGEGRQRIGKTPRYEPIAPFVAFVLLTGCRFGEALAVTWEQVDLDALDHAGQKVGEIHLAGADSKTKHARTIGLEVSPALRAMLAARRPKDAKGSVFRLSAGTANAAAKRLRAEYRAPASFTWQALRRTCGTFLTNAPGIFGAASAYRSAKQLGHSVAVAEKHYLGLVRGISLDVRTLEGAMGLVL